jgi:putative transposase
MMARPLDGTALLAYFRRFGFSRETQELLTHIRSSPPSRTPGARRGNMPVWYPSKKMQCIIKAESHKVEFAFLLQAEHDDAILEIWDQPPPIQLEYRDRRHHLQRPWHTADYFVFGVQECGWIECKPAQELVYQAELRPQRYICEDQHHWRCPPGEVVAARYGLTYRVWTSDQVNWAAQDNWLYLDEYYADLDQLVIPEAALATLVHLVEETPGITLANLQMAAGDISADLINIAIARQDLYVDLATYRLSEPWRTPVFRNRRVARAIHPPTPRAADQKPPALSPEKRRNIAPAGHQLLEQAREVDLATAVFRDRILHPSEHDDAEQAQIAAQAATIPARTKRRWQQRYHVLATE